MIPADRLFRAFADATRLRILNLLTKGELCVCDIRDVIGAPQPKISRHLAALKRAGLVTDRQEGPWRHYSLAKPSGALHGRLIDCIAGCLARTPALRRDADKLARAARERCR